MPSWADRRVHILKSIRVHLNPGSQLVCVLMQTLVIVTTVRIFVANLGVESVPAP